MKPRQPRDAILWFVFYPSGSIAGWTGARLRKDSIKAFIDGVDGMPWPYLFEKGYRVIKRQVEAPWKITANARDDRDPD